MKKYFSGLIVIILAIILTLTGCATQSKAPSQVGLGEELVVEFIDVGQGDAILLQASNQVMLIDTGDNGTEKNLVQHLKDKGIKKIDYLIGTHPHADHIGGMDKVIDQFEIGQIYMAKKSHTSKTYESVLMAIKNKGYKVLSGKAGVSFTFGKGIKVEMLSPIREEYSELNDYSIVMKVTNNEDSFLFTGDAEKEVEHDLLEAKVNLEADVLKLGHHGSSTSNTAEFIEAVSPEYAVILSGLDNKYGHPHKETMEVLTKEQISYYDTKLNGNITFTSNGQGIAIKTEK
ncbi:MAG: ComEC/Rec2 family competence protein [Cellulosilyticaceae bacterium]